jgi:uncharacterized protein YbaP (TraB family)
MRNKTIFLLILLVGAVFEPAWAENADATATPVAAATPHLPSSIPQRGTLYRVRYQDHTSYLFGTIHIGKPDFFPLEDQLTQAFTEADTFMLELDLRNTASLQSAVKKYGMYADNDTLDKHLSPASLKRLKDTLAHAGIPFASVAQMKPWMIANLLTVAALERKGYHTEQGTDKFLLDAAEAQGKNVQELESADSQLSLFEGMKEKQQEQYLNDNLDELQNGAALKKAQELIDAWGNADEKAFDNLLRETLNDHSASGKFLRDILLAKRNPAMAVKIEALLKSDKVSFVGVGLLHLLGANGVPQLLARRGYEVTRLY